MYHLVSWQANLSNRRWLLLQKRWKWNDPSHVWCEGPPSAIANQTHQEADYQHTCNNSDGLWWPLIVIIHVRIVCFLMGLMVNGGPSHIWWVIPFTPWSNINLFSLHLFVPIVQTINSFAEMPFFIISSTPTHVHSINITYDSTGYIVRYFEVNIFINLYILPNIQSLKHIICQL